MGTEEKAETTETLFHAFEQGQVRRGLVRSIERFGVFVDLDGAEGFVNVAELSWRRFEDTGEIVRIGQEVVGMVLHVDLEREQVSLSLKALQDDPLVEIARTRLGEVITGPVTKVVPFGVFVKVVDGLEGLVHISEFSDGRVLTEGEELTVRLSDINLLHHRLRLTLA
ncbi:S1 RNA-binding domain-containing protein [Nonomuraea harbinensis]|uniref:S1 RNA-binding domain-containing protein n=1 Tax=Nonomuraea harbinensis TaxID=1286938 RepID=A0ABW1C4A2_9ACTN|nr:S1 RNA-binding domain-containing protein [Nonomuraea harbinensis]